MPVISVDHFQILVLTLFSGTYCPPFAQGPPPPALFKKYHSYPMVSNILLFGGRECESLRVFLDFLIHSFEVALGGQMICRKDRQDRKDFRGSVGTNCRIHRISDDLSPKHVR